jgi:methyl-accepting chemotaxis protein
MLRKWFVAIPIAVLAIGGSTACASKKFVRTSVGEVNDKVDAVGRSVEETQERTRKNEGRISEVDQKADAAHQAARQANDAASAANSAATAVGGKVDDMDRSNRRLVYEVVLNEDSGNFKFGDHAAG